MRLMHDALSQTMSEIQRKNKQRDLLFDGLKSIKYNSDSEELMVNAPSMAYIISDLGSLICLYCQIKRENGVTIRNLPLGITVLCGTEENLNKTFVSIRF